jgi:hypothetical protein
LPPSHYAATMGVGAELGAGNELRLPHSI